MLNVDELKQELVHSRNTTVILSILFVILTIAFAILSLLLYSSNRQLETALNTDPHLTITDITDPIRYNQYLVFETYPDPDNPSNRNHSATLYYVGPIPGNETKDTIIDLYYFNNVDISDYPVDDISATWYTID